MICDSSKLLLPDHKKWPCFHHSFYRKNFFSPRRGLPERKEKHDGKPGAECAPGFLIPLLDVVEIDALGITDKDQTDNQGHRGDRNRIP